MQSVDVAKMKVFNIVTAEFATPQSSNSATEEISVYETMYSILKFAGSQWSLVRKEVT